MSSNTTKGAKWLHNEVRALLDLWMQRDIQEQLSKYHSKYVYDVISQRLSNQGIVRTGEQCREKIKKIKLDYKCLVKNNYAPTFARSTRRLMGFYNQVHEIFGTRFVAKPSSVIESLVLNEKLMEKKNNEDSDPNVEKTTVSSSANDSSGPTKCKNNVETMKPCLENSLKNDTTSMNTISLSNNLGNKFQHSKIKNFQKHLNSITYGLIKKQEKLHKRFILLEKNRFASELEREKQRLTLADQKRQMDQKREIMLLKSFFRAMRSKQNGSSHLSIEGLEQHSTSTLTQ